MALFVLNCIDKAGGLDLRLATRATHLEYLQGKGDQVKLAGPYLDEAGQPTGSMVIIEAEDLAAAQAFADADPYKIAGLFSHTDIRAYRVVLGGTK